MIYLIRKKIGKIPRNLARDLGVDEKQIEQVSMPKDVRESPEVFSDSVAEHSGIGSACAILNEIGSNAIRIAKARGKPFTIIYNYSSGWKQKPYNGGKITLENTTPTVMFVPPSPHIGPGA